LALSVAHLPAIRTVVPIPAVIDRVIILIALVRVIFWAAGGVAGTTWAVGSRIEKRAVANADADAYAPNMNADANLC
jgi:hypothetical protein